MDHGTETGIRDEPLTTGFKREVNGLFRTEIETNAAAFTLNGIYLIIFTDSVPPAQIPAQVAFGTLILIDPGRMTSLKILPFSGCGRHDQVKICRVHISIAENLVFSQSSKGGD